MIQYNLENIYQLNKIYLICTPKCLLSQGTKWSYILYWILRTEWLLIINLKDKLENVSSLWRIKSRYYIVNNQVTDQASTNQKPPHQLFIQCLDKLLLIVLNISKVKHRNTINDKHMYKNKRCRVCLPLQLNGIPQDLIQWISIYIFFFPCAQH